MSKYFRGYRMIHRLTSDNGSVPWVGDHLALDLLNTQARGANGTVEYWQSDDDVMGWLRQAGIAAPSACIDRDSLLAEAMKLRSLARRLIERHKEGIAEDLSELNIYLHAYLSSPHLERISDGTLVLTYVTHGEGIDSLLGPIAQAVAQLLAEGDAGLIKQCEHPDCILWFYDRTKAHRRRWCSMAVCGNRYKAAQFRKKSQAHD